LPTLFDAQQFSLTNFQIIPIPNLAVKVSTIISVSDKFGAHDSCRDRSSGHFADLPIG